MKIFGSISELVDLAFRLAGGKQVKIKAATQTTAGNLVTVNVPDVAATGDTQNMVLASATQTLTNKALTSPNIDGGTIDDAVVGGNIPAAGTFTDTISAKLTVTSPTVGHINLQTLTIPSFNDVSGGILHSTPSTGVISSSKIVNADVDAAAALAFSKLASLPSAQILVGSGLGVATPQPVSGDVTISNAGATTIGASKVTNSMLAGSIDRSKLNSGTNFRILANNNFGVMSENAPLTPNEAVASDTNGQLVSVTGVSITELGYLSGVTSDIQTQISNKQDTITGAASSVTTLDLTASRALASDASGKISQSTVTATELGYVSGVTSAIQTQLGTKANTSGKLSQFAATSSSELAGVISDETGSGSLVFGTSPVIGTPSITGGTVDDTTSNRLRSAMDSAAIATATLAATKGFMRITAGESTLSTISDPSGKLALSGVNLVLNNFSVASDVTITNAGNIVTGTGDNFILKQGASVSLVHNGNSKFVLTGGAGSAAGGLTTSPLATTLSPAVKNTHYLTNTSSAAFSVTLPAGAAGSVIRFSDANETWSTNALTIIPATGEKIDNLGINETLVCDVRRGWVELSWNTALSSWSFQSLSSTVAASATTSNPGVITLKVPTQSKFISGSGTYTVPTGVLYLKVRMVGGGGGGGGTGTGSSAGGTGGNTTFGTSFLTANGGSGGGNGATIVGYGGAGGAATIGAGAIGFSLPGGTGGGGQGSGITTVALIGGSGASSSLGGAGQSVLGSGTSAITNSGSGGAGGGASPSGQAINTGGGGGAGAYIDAIISPLLSSYSYNVGAAGTAGTVGTSGHVGGAGGSGVIIIDEYYY